MTESLAALKTTPELEEASKLLHFKVVERRLEQVWRQFEEAGFRPVLIKGWAAAQFYPKPHERHFSDVDLAFDPEEFGRAQAFKAARNFPLEVDLHKGLRHLDTAPFAEISARGVDRPCGEALIRVPCDEDHLRILIVHWLNDGGAPRERLWDIYYAVANRGAKFDWEKCLGAVERKRRRWIVCGIALAHLYLDLPADDLPFKDELKNVPAWLIKTIESEWASGVSLRPLNACLGDRAELWRQIKKRIPPNALQATIETEGDFDRGSRIGYQIRDVFKRLAPWFERWI